VKAPAVAANVAVLDPAATVMGEGTETLDDPELRLTGTPPVPAGPLRPRAHCAAVLGVRFVGVQVRLLIPTALVFMPMVPLVPVSAMELPSKDTAHILVNPMVAAVLPERVTAT